MPISAQGLLQASPEMGLLLLVLIFLVASVILHEIAHALVALWCGDTTARDLGRITLNPIPHIDPFMTILLPAILFFASGMMFGGARPVPVNFHNLRHPHRDMALVAIAGPLTNFLLAGVFLLLFRIACAETEYFGPDSKLAVSLRYAVQVNCILAVFNMLPIPPLDGSRVMTWLLPASMRPAYVGLERFGLLIVFGLLFTGMLHPILVVTVEPMMRFWAALIPPFAP